SLSFPPPTPFAESPRGRPLPFLVAFPPSASPPPPAHPPARGRAAAPAATASTAAVDTSWFRGLSWRQIGPFRGGRVDAVVGDPKQPLVFYFGATGGGVWKTTDGGLSWRPLGDGQLSAGSIGAVAVA